MADEIDGMDEAGRTDGTEGGQRTAALLAEADALIRLRRYGPAAERARQASALAPLDYRPFCEWSRALYGAERYHEAGEMADEAIRLAPTTAVGFRLKATALSTLARTSGSDRKVIGRAAVTAGREAVRLAPADATGHIVLAQALPLVGALREADASMQRAIALAPNAAATWVAASLVALSAKHWRAAVDACQRALAIDPDNYAALNNLGVALRAAGRGRAGNEALARAARVDPDAPTARRNLSRAGIYVIRAVVLVLLLPLLLVAHVGFLLYLAVVIGSNLLISRNPGLVSRMERWAAPVALRLSKHSDGPVEQTGRSGRGWRRWGSHREESRPDQPWSAFAGRHPITTPAAVIGAIGERVRRLRTGR